MTTTTTTPLTPETITGGASHPLTPELASSLMSPALLIYLEHVRHNVAQMINHCQGDPDRWRPHLKTTKIPQIWSMLLDDGIRNFKCATTREAACLLALLEKRDINDADLLIAYPLIGPALKRAAELARRHTRCRISVLCEDPSAVNTVPEPLGIFIDINPEMNRTGIRLGDRSTVVNVARAAGARFRGLHPYDGHLRDSDPSVRRRAAWAVYDELVELCAELTANDLVPGEIITSGSLTFLDALAHTGLGALSTTMHRISPGTVVFSDVTTQQCVGEAGLRPAAVVMSRVVSLPSPGVATCDAGSKALAAEAGDPCVVVVGHPELTARTPSEEHLPLEVEGGVSSPQRGDVLLLIPRHVCPTVNLAQQAVLIESNGATEVVSVAGGGHELTT